MHDGDVISVLGIRGYGYHGVLESERADGQEFSVDVALTVNTADAARDDDLALTVNYADVAERVHAHITGQPYALIETLAHRIAEELFAIPLVHAVTVTVHKPHAPIQVPFSDVTVSITHRK